MVNSTRNQDVDARIERHVLHQGRVLTAVDLFAGSGGFSLGLRRAGFDVVLANEMSVDAEWTYRHNILDDTSGGLFPERPQDPSARVRRGHRCEVRRQILAERETHDQGLERQMRGGDIRDALPDPWLQSWSQHHPEGVDLLVAGPPCQGFSCAGRASLDDERNLLVHEAMRVIRVIQPRIALIENVPGMLHRHADLICELGLQLSQQSTRAPGYFVYAELVHTEPFGVPQTRRRMILVAVRRDVVDPCASDGLASLLFPVACPVSRPTDGRLLGAVVETGSSLTAREILSDLARNPPLYGAAQSWTQSYRRNGRPLDSKFLCEIRAPKPLYLDGRVTEQNAKPILTEYFNHEASLHQPHVARRIRLLRLAAENSREGRQNRCSSGWLRSRLRGHSSKLITKKLSQRVLLADEWPMLTVTSLPDDIVHYDEESNTDGPRGCTPPDVSRLV